ncbi:hypothetical protein ERJ75_001247800 [Trypanosoma vivax]|uniref:C3H1-type domain-containing protein n=1 Tax=Trypanosoma vivax (strain Y486) TaxID=1055687 RepID=G0UD20_TRYVY|nr:hypothetical protein TRVL_04092 [Trypanosoma vivax]KAH8609053.1 hypothetical protein ERJ75_001247800 [Trypanosoma vivax]CCC53730.1 conserved hypothetical protein [Trypanosoma vivax Y486]
MAGGKKGKRRSPQRLLSADSAPPGTFPVIDTLSKMLYIPQSEMLDTLAVHRRGVPTLCRLFLEGRCRQGNLCHQAHANICVVQKLREIALREPTCCRQHFALSDTSGIPPDLRIAVVGKKKGEKLFVCSLDNLAVTRGLRALIRKRFGGTFSEEPVLNVPVSSLCRLHNTCQCCRFGQECNFVHICRQYCMQLKASDTESDAEKSVVAAPIEDDDIFAPTRSPLPLRTRAPSLSNEGDGQLGSTAGQFVFPRPFFINRQQNMGGDASSPGTPRLETSPAMSRSCTSTSLGVVWRHNPYGLMTPTSSVIET